MWEHDATEYSFRNGYEKGKKDALKWISVNERLPETDGRYLVHKNLWGSTWFDVISFAKDGRKIDEYDFQKNWENVWYNYDSEWGHVTTDSVTHWMPLPEAPKED